MIALNDVLLSRDVRASPDMEKQIEYINAAIPEMPATARNSSAHGRPFSSALSGFEYTYSTCPLAVIKHMYTSTSRRFPMKIDVAGRLAPSTADAITPIKIKYHSGTLALINLHNGGPEVSLL